jgi:hypothetical protein
MVSRTVRACVLAVRPRRRCRRQLILFITEDSNGVQRQSGACHPSGPVSLVGYGDGRKLAPRRGSGTGSGGTQDVGDGDGEGVSLLARDVPVAIPSPARLLATLLKDLGVSSLRSIKTMA